MALKQTKALELECMARAQGRNLVSALGSTPQYPRQKSMPLRQRVLENLDSNYRYRNIYILSDSQAVIKIAMQDAFFIIKST
jgi:hypothetical protein